MNNNEKDLDEILGESTTVNDAKANKSDTENNDTVKTDAKKKKSTLSLDLEEDSLLDDILKDEKKSEQKTKRTSKINLEYQPEEKKTNIQTDSSKLNVALKIVSMVSLIVIAVVAVTFLIVFLLGNSESNHILTFNGKKISVEEYKMCIDFVDKSQEDYKTQAYDLLIDYLLMNKAIDDNNITMTAEENEQILQYIQQYKDYVASLNLLAPNITDKRLTYLLRSDLLLPKLQALYSTDEIADMDDYLEQLDYYKREGMQDYAQTQMRVIITDTEQNANDARDELLAGADIVETDMKYSLYKDEEGYAMQKLSLSEIGLDADFVTHLLSLQTGNISNVLMLQEDTAYAVFIMDFIYIPNDEEIQEIFDEMYKSFKNNERFSEEYYKWYDAAKIVRNDSVFANFVR